MPTPVNEMISAQPISSSHHFSTCYREDTWLGTTNITRDFFDWTCPLDIHDYCRPLHSLNDLPDIFSALGYYGIACNVDYWSEVRITFIGDKHDIGDSLGDLKKFEEADITAQTYLFEDFEQGVTIPCFAFCVSDKRVCMGWDESTKGEDLQLTRKGHFFHRRSENICDFDDADELRTTAVAEERFPCAFILPKHT